MHQSGNHVINPNYIILDTAYNSRQHTTLIPDNIRRKFRYNALIRSTIRHYSGYNITRSEL